MPGRCSQRFRGQRPSRGFTLLELLVVLVIIGVLVGLAALRIGTDREAVVHEEARRLMVLLDLASDEAVLQGRELGVQFTRQEYRFVYLATVDGELLWLPLEGDQILRPRRLPDDLRMQLLLDGLRQALPAAFADRQRPQLFLHSSGERSPFELHLALASGTRGGAGAGLQLSGGYAGVEFAP